MGLLFSSDNSNSSTTTRAAHEIQTLAQKQRLLQKGNLVLLVYSEHCGPCRVFKPQYNAFIQNHGQKYRKLCYFAQECISLGLSPNVSAIPTLLFFKQGTKRPFLETHGNQKDLFKGLQQMTRIHH